MVTTDIAKLIHELGMTPSGLADELGLPRGQISRLIVGEEKPDRLTDWALAGLRAARLGDAPKTRRRSAKPSPANALADELADDTWAGQTARLALPILVEIAQNGGPKITYTELHEKVVARGGKPDIGKMTKYAFPLDRIARAVQRLKAPPLTTLVVKGGSTEQAGLPSSGIDLFIVHYLDLDRERAAALKNDLNVRREIVRGLWGEVFAYKDWSAVMAQLGVTGDPAYDL